MINLNRIKCVRGDISIPGDKSISHRGIMLGSIASGTTVLQGFLNGADCRSTISCFRSMGIHIDHCPSESRVTILGKGLDGLSAPEKTLDVGNSGTTMRLISGILAGQDFDTSITGDASIQKRPMGRIITPLKMMGTDISSADSDGHAPLTIRHKPIHGIIYNSPVASAQVKSCVLLAGLYAQEDTLVTEPIKSRDHTERMLTAFGADVSSDGYSASVTPRPDLRGRRILIPGDISSAAYWIAAALITPNSELMIRNVNTNPTRDGIIRIAKQMGGDITLVNEHSLSGEPAANLLVRSSSLHGVTVAGNIIPTLIDELPVVALMAACADGETIIKDAAELRVKESDRIKLVTDNLSAMGADVTPTEDGMIIQGGKPLHGAFIKTGFDHRIAMTFAIASMIADGETQIDDESCVKISYPDFFNTMNHISLK